MMRKGWMFGLGALLLAATTCGAGEGHGHGGVCCPTVTVEKVDDYCWEVRSKEICIPPVQFPWQRCFGCGKGKGEGCCAAPSHHCGKVRCVKYLWQQPRQREECVYEWNVAYPGKGKCDALYEEAIPADAAGEIPAPPPVSAAQAPASARVRLLQR